MNAPLDQDRISRLLGSTYRPIGEQSIGNPAKTLRDVEAAKLAMAKLAMAKLAMAKPVLVGESNPYGADPSFALYPSPESSAGYRLCTMVLGMSRKQYLETFERVNLCAGKWSMKEAREKAATLRGPFILCGSKVCKAFDVPFQPFTVVGMFQTSPARDCQAAIIPHPSGLCRIWTTDKDAVAKARATIIEAIPELKLVIGRDHAD